MSKTIVLGCLIVEFFLFGLIFTIMGNPLKFHETTSSERTELLPVDDLKPGNDTGTVNKLITLCKQSIKGGNMNTAMIYADSALTLADSLNYRKGQADAYYNIGRICHVNGDISDALKNHKTALRIRKETGDMKGTAYSYGNLGTIHLDQGNYPEALENFQATIKIFEETGTKKGRQPHWETLGTFISIWATILKH